MRIVRTKKHNSHPAAGELTRLTRTFLTEKAGLPAGPSTSLRSGRDDNFVLESIFLTTTANFATKLSSRPERSVVEGHPVDARLCVSKIGDLIGVG